LGLAQLLGIKLQTPEMFANLAKEFQSSSVDLTRLRSTLPLVSLDEKFSETWWLDEKGELFIPQSVSGSVIDVHGPINHSFDSMLQLRGFG
jgi:hypothetical protein